MIRLSSCDSFRCHAALCWLTGVLDYNSLSRTPVTKAPIVACANCRAMGDCNFFCYSTYIRMNSPVTLHARTQTTTHTHTRSYAPIHMQIVSSRRYTPQIDFNGSQLRSRSTTIVSRTCFRRPPIYCGKHFSCGTRFTQRITSKHADV